jgi:hypothetical protein
MGFGRKCGSGERSRKLELDHRWGGKLWRAKPKSVGG